MGEDSIRPFLEYPGKWTIVLGLTSNSGAKDFELQACSGDLLYEKVLNAVSRWGTTENLMFVIGATQGAEFENVRRITPDHFYLVPGVGAQGGNLQEISAKAMIADIGLLVNVSRDIIFSSGGRDFQAMAGKKAADFQMEMEKCLESA
jgi:orotidine-5'-phosphate decarboxylase